MRALKNCLVTFTILYSAQSLAISTSLFDTLFASNIKHLDAAIAKLSLDQHASKQLRNSVLAATEALKANDKSITSTRWTYVMKDYLRKTGGQFPTLKRFESEYTDRMSYKSLSKVFDEYLLLAESYGARKYLLVAGDNCSLDSLSKVGIKRAFSIPKKNSTVNLLRYKLPRSINSLKRHTKRKFKEYKLGNFSRASAMKLKSDIEYRQLAYFTGVLEEGTKAEKRLAKSIINFNTSSGRTELLSHDKFWRIFSDISSSDMPVKEQQELMSKLSDFMNRASHGRSNASKKHASFKEMIEEKVSENPALKKSYQKYIDSKCY